MPADGSLQDADYGFRYTMADYIANRLKFISLDRKVLKKDAASTRLTAEEEGQFRGAVASINWVAREGRPDASAAASIYAGRVPTATIADVHAVNLVIEHLKKFHVVLRVHPVAEKDIRHFVIADSAFDVSGKEKSQHGWLQGVTTPALNGGKEAPISLIGWRSRKLRRKAANTLLCESMSMSAAVGALEKQVATWRSFTVSRYDPKEIAVDMEVELGLRGSSQVLAEQEARIKDPIAVAVVDAKSLYDAAASEQAQGDDDRSALEIAIIQESLAKLLGRMRWVPHNVNPADALTKVAGAHEAPLMRLLTSNAFCIEEEAAVLAKGKQSASRLKAKA